MAGSSGNPITNLGSTIKGQGTTVQPTPSTPSNTTPSTGQWYDNPNWKQPVTQPQPSQPQFSPDQYSQQLYGSFYGQPYGQNQYRPTINPNQQIYGQSNQTFQNPYASQNPYAPQNPYASQNGYQPYYRPPMQNSYGGRFGRFK
jgi:hypothetical protein